MPAALPGSTPVQNAANPSLGNAVIFCPLSGPKASPLDARKIASWNTNGSPVYANDPANISTGALSTGIGFGSGSARPGVLGVGSFTPKSGNFTDDYVPGQDLPSGAATSAALLYIGGGRSNADGTPNPYSVGELGICMAGNGGSRDGGTSPFTGFPVKSVTATGAVANGAAVEAGFVNRSGTSLLTGESVFGSSATPLADVA